MQESMLIGVDWGGTKIETIALEPDGREIARLREETPRGDYKECILTIDRQIRAIEAETGRRGSIGIGLPGSVDPRTGIAKGASSTWMNGKPVISDLRAILRRDIRAENDADCLAASEAVDGAGAGHNVVFAVILGTGVGAGVAVGGRAHHGPNNSAGDWGHNTLPIPDVTEIPGAACYCGKHGCIETWVSGRGFEKDYRRHAQVDLNEEITLRAWQIVEKMRGGDRLARLVWERYINRLARSMATVVGVLDPDIFVMGGGMSNIDELYTDLPPEVARYTFSPVFYTPIKKALHGDSSGVRGAAWLWK